jgi:aryl-alcohol dehydrogenase-like predicted oxidoreductase
VPFDKEKGYSIVDSLKEVAKRHDASPARVALAWVQLFAGGSLSRSGWS